MNRTIRWMTPIFAVFCFSVSAAAQDPVGMIKISKGQVSVQRGDARVAGHAGLNLYQADRVLTGAASAVGISMKDGSLLSAGPNSSLSLDKFSFDVRTDAGRMSVGISRGTLSVVTGRIARQSPESVDFHTPLSILGVRGTAFVIEIVNGDE